jgi:hypothetical protein
VSNVPAVPCFNSAHFHFQIVDSFHFSRADVFPGSPTITDDAFIAFKANWIDVVAKTGVFSRLLVSDEDSGGPNMSVRIASTDTEILTLIARQEPRLAQLRLRLLLVLKWSLSGRMMSDEDNPSCGGIYLAKMGSQDSNLTQLVSLGLTLVPNTTTDERIKKVGEGLSFDGQYLAFWGTWGSDTKRVRLFCPETGNRDRRYFCKCNDTDTTREDGVQESAT